MENNLFENYTSWGLAVSSKQVLHEFNWAPGTLQPLLEASLPMLPHGQGKSYGDSCLNDGGILLLTRHLNHFLRFDPETGLLRCESGMTLGEILDLIVPQGWFLPVVPGTKHVSVGGAIANDIHGKNHHRKGSFGSHVTQFALLRSNGRPLICSPSMNQEWFQATIGGLGLTGLILWAEIQLTRVHSSWIDFEQIRFKRLTDFFKLSEESDKNYEYTVAWIDGVKKGEKLRYGIFFRGNHAQDGRKNDHISGRRKCLLSVPCQLPFNIINRYTLRFFNALYYHKQLFNTLEKKVPFESFFFPLDSLGRWSRLYGKRGLLQYQCVIPMTEAPSLLSRIFLEISLSYENPSLVILKVFGDRPSPGILSFPRKGVTLAVDFPNTEDRIKKLFEKLDQIVRDCGGSVYPAKDALMSAKAFRAFFPQWKSFSAYVDPHFSSSFWRRVTS